jgi:6-phosphogluconolactonase
MKSRLPLLICVVALSVITFIPSAAVCEDDYFVYVGTYTEQDSTSKGIYEYRYDSGTGKLTPVGLAVETNNPSFLAIHPNHRYLYAVNEVNFKGEKTGAVSAFVIDPATGKLKLLNQIASGGAGPCYLTVDRSGKYLLVANYDSGSVASFPILADGRLGAISGFAQHSGHGANPKRQEAAHAHSIDPSMDDRFVIVDDLGIDETFIYKFDKTNGSLTPNDPPFVKASPGAGPRHLAFSPLGDFAYVIDEMGSTVSVFSYDRGELHPVQTISSLPKSFTGHSDAAEIEVHPSGKFLYASNRGYDSIAVFAIDPKKGTLTSVEYPRTKGEGPRNFAIDPTGKFIVGNEKSDNIVVFSIDQQTGKLTPTGKVFELSQPVCIKFVPLQ